MSINEVNLSSLIKSGKEYTEELSQKKTEKLVKKFQIYLHTLKEIT